MLIDGGAKAAHVMYDAVYITVHCATVARSILRLLHLLIYVVCPSVGAMWYHTVPHFNILIILPAGAFFARGTHMRQSRQISNRVEHVCLQHVTGKYIR